MKQKKNAEFDWTKFLDIARDLNNKLNKKYGDAAYRCAVSRAYYSAFCFVRNYARNNMGFIPDYNADDHRKIIDFLNSKNKSDIADDLEELRKWRNMCDYYDIIKDQYDLRSMSAWAIIKADSIITDIALKNPPL
jgi:uncharacterized protein (UPF0332 family)